MSNSDYIFLTSEQRSVKKQLKKEGKSNISIYLIIFLGIPLFFGLIGLIFSMAGDGMSSGLDYIFSNTNKKTNMQSNIQPNMQTNMQPSIQSNMQPSIQSNMQPSIQSNMQPSIQPSMQTNMQPSMQTNMQPSMQTNMQPSMQTNMQPSIQPNIIYINL